MEEHSFTPMFNVHPMASAAQHGPMSHGYSAQGPRSGNASTYGNARAMAWDVHRGMGSAPEALNSLNSGTTRKFDSGPGYQPVEAR